MPRWVRFGIVLGLAVGGSQAEAGTRYATTPFMEPDRCAVAWLVKREIEPDATFEFHTRDSFPDGVVLFDLPESTIKRDARRSALEVLLDREGLESPFLDELTRLVHDVEINAWSSRRDSESINFEQIMVDALTDQEDPARALELCFGLLDTLRESGGDVTGWSMLWRDERGAIRLNAPSMYHLERPGLDNLIRVSDRIYSGAEPQGEAGFDSLRRLGVEVVVSVDGALPDVESARARGMRYVHLPIGYDGVPRETAAALRQVARTSDAKIYVHCHHGRHRGPVAAALLLHLDEGAPRQSMLDLLVLAGTNEGYAGLWRDVRVFDAGTLGDLRPELHERVAVPDFTAQMAQLDRVWDRLKLARLSGWRSIPGHPDVAPAHEARMLWEGFREARRLEERPGGDELTEALDEAIGAAETLRRALEQSDIATADAAYSRLGISCGRCHEAHRGR